MQGPSHAPAHLHLDINICAFHLTFFHDQQHRYQEDTLNTTATMSDTSSVKAIKESTTRPTSVSGGDTESVISAPQIPGAPPPTRTHTVAGDLPDYDYIQAKLANAHLSTPPTSVRAGEDAAGAKLGSITSEESAEFMEANNWAENAEEDLLNALHRIATAANDEHKADPSKSVEEYYSVRVAKVLKEGPIKFDTEYLK
ncbi:uncharacterized protein MYCFIDRAFT_77044 [Pseudocercospora fijiensis CIRAD86]|uniref:Uncharacterized protein n=1 Tax=Pseudocercospora fijiensis (strain CIRAD86) TaxID=383855 RepID=M3A913_PSEFD|nr:uncharacterized protein MYCFIDRAFT_77044 [Pseudocercospora fijiensis CIRAD86]EME81116.1 hypothetical protein MYCFIDRAFT_77044 [Pseudocercospora fijiensis CIRAD86]